MKTSNVPGYKDLFPEGADLYADLVKDISSETIIRVCSALNNELNGLGGLHGTQGSIFQDLAKTFSSEERKELSNGLAAFRTKMGVKTPMLIFGTRYLVSMVLKELNEFRNTEQEDDKVPMEFKFFKAYLLVIDEEAAKDHNMVDLKSSDGEDPLKLMRILLMPIIRQFEFNERSNALFETYKTACFFNYLQNSAYRPYLKEFLDSLKFKHVGAYLASCNQVNNSIQSFDPDAKMLKRLTYIKPNEQVDQTHLRTLSINLLKQTKFSLTDLKKAPLVYAAARESYMVVDYNYSIKKMFRGAFFEIVHQTSLTKAESISREEKNTIFNTYSQRAADAFEKHYFKPVMELFTAANCDYVHFDDGTANIPDAYVRIGHNVLLFEFKAYVFREDLAAKPDFDKLIGYLEDRFVTSDSDKPKGVGQLVRQIELFHEDYFKFDEVANELLKKGELHFYPVIVYNDFNFSMPGFNTYLNQRMWELLEDKPTMIDSVKPLVMLNLETIMSIVLEGRYAQDLGQLIYMYYQFLMQRRAELPHAPTISNFATAHCSFDEFYNAFIEKPRSGLKDKKDLLRDLLNLSGIDFEQFNKDI